MGTGFVLMNTLGTCIRAVLDTNGETADGDGPVYTVSRYISGLGSLAG